MKTQANVACVKLETLVESVMNMQQTSEYQMGEPTWESGELCRSVGVMCQRDGLDGRYRLTVVHLPEHDLVIATEEASNRGLSVMAHAEALATLAISEDLVEPARLVWVEHWPNANAGTGMLVGTRFCLNADGTAGKARWSPMTVTDWLALGLLPETGLALALGQPCSI